MACSYAHVYEKAEKICLPVRTLKNKEIRKIAHWNSKCLTSDWNWNCFICQYIFFLISTFGMETHKFILVESLKITYLTITYYAVLLILLLFIIITSRCHLLVKRMKSTKLGNWFQPSNSRRNVECFTSLTTISTVILNISLYCFFFYLKSSSGFCQTVDEQCNHLNAKRG